MNYLLVASNAKDGKNGKNGGKNGKNGKNGGKNGKNGKNGGKNGPNEGGKNGPGAVGVTEFEGEEKSESITVLFNLTVNVYGVLAFSPVTIIGDRDPVACMFDGEETAVYVKELFGLPVYVGAVKLTVAWFAPATAVPIIGVPGLRPSEDDIGPIFDIRQLSLQELPIAQYHA